MPGFFDAVTPQGPSGLLGTMTPQEKDQANSLGLLALASGMVRGDFGGGLAGAGQVIGNAQENALKQRLLGMQVAAHDMALQQQKQEWEMRMPFMRAMADSMQGGAGPAPAAGGQPAIPPSPGGSLGSGTFGIPIGGQSGAAARPAAPASGGGGGFLGIPADVLQGTIALEGFKGVAPLITKFNEPTELMRTLAASGVQRGSPEWNQAMTEAVAKANYIAPVNARPGSILRDPRDPSRIIAFNPHVPDGSAPIFNGGNVVGIAPISGALPAITRAEEAKKWGDANTTPSVVYNNGVPDFSTRGNDLRRAGAVPPGELPPAEPGVSGNFRGNPADIIAQLPANLPPQERANILASIQEQVRRSPNPNSLTPEQRPGVVKGAELGQNELSKKGQELMANNAQVGTVISRLQNIKALAPGAIAGVSTDRRDYFNGLLALAGIKGAEDAKTASDLVDKNAAQIVSALRMGQGGAGTDALQTLLGAANPNRHMTKEAIAEAADQLIASQQMIQDKAKLLQPHYLGRDPVAYGQKEMAFDQNADPRIWQLQSMTPQQQAAYVKSLPPDVAAEILRKRQALKGLGAF